MNTNKTHFINLISVFSALSLILILMINLPLIPSAPFLKYDPGDIPIVIAGLLLGLYPAILISFIVCFIQSIFISSDGGIIGMFMHFVATATFSSSIAFFYGIIKNKYRLILSLLIGSISMVIAMVLLNIVFTPIFLGLPIELIYKMLIPIIIPFNVLKVCINSFLIFVIFSPLKRYLMYK